MLDFRCNGSETYDGGGDISEFVGFMRRQRTGSAPHSKIGRPGHSSLMASLNFRLRFLWCETSLREVLRNELLGNFSSRFPRLFHVSVPFREELESSVRFYAVFE